MHWKPHNITGTIHCGNREKELCNVIGQLLDTNSTLVIGHYTGAMSVVGDNDSVLFMSCGFEVHDFWVLVQGEGPAWIEFANRLEVALNCANFPFTIRVHDYVVNGPQDPLNR